MRLTPHEIQRYDARKFYALIFLSLVMIGLIIAQTVTAA